MNVASIGNWERNLSAPRVGYMPAIIRFLCYNPLQPSDGWANRLVQACMALGLSQKDAAARMGVEQCTLARWERGDDRRGGEGGGAERADGVTLTESGRRDETWRLSGTPRGVRTCF